MNLWKRIKVELNCWLKIEDKISAAPRDLNLEEISPPGREPTHDPHAWPVGIRSQSLVLFLFSQMASRMASRMVLVFPVETSCLWFRTSRRPLPLLLPRTFPRLGRGIQQQTSQIPGVWPRQAWWAGGPSARGEWLSSWLLFVSSCS